MGTSGAMMFPGYAPKGPRWKAAPVLATVFLLHAALAVVLQSVAHPPRPLAAPVDPAASVAVVILSDSKGSGARLSDRYAAPSSLPAPALAAVRAPADPFDEHPRDTAVDPRYLPPSKLDIGPSPAGAPDFALATRGTLAIGKVTLRVYVSAFGLPDRVEILGLPLDPEFAQALRRAMEQTTFLPGRLGGRDVAAFVDYEFQNDVVVLPPPSNRRPS
jgi:hypothetical protein